MTQAPHRLHPRERPLSQAQLRLWQMERSAGTKARPNALLCLEVDAGVDQGRLLAAVHQVVGEAGSFHATLAGPDALPHWTHSDTQAFSVCSLTAPESAGTADDAGTALPPFVRELCRSEALHMFDLRRQPPLRVFLAQAGPSGRRFLLLNFCPLVMARSQLDGVQADLVRALQGQADGAAADTTGHALPSAPVPDTAELAAFMADAARAGQLQPFPVDRPRDLTPCLATACHAFLVPAAKVAALAALHGPGPHAEFLGLLLVYAAVLARCSQQEEMVLGVAAAGLQPGAGTLLNHVPVQFVLGHDLHFANGLQAAAQALQRARACAPAFSLEPLLARLHPGTAGSFSPVSQLAYSHHAAHDDTPASTSAGLTRHEPDEPNASFSPSELELKSWRLPSGDFHCVLQYATALFTPATAARLARHCLHAIDAVLARPALCIGELGALADGQQAMHAAPQGSRDSAVDNGTALHTTPLALSALLDTPDSARLRGLRRVVCSGGAVSPALARRFFQALPQARLFKLHALANTGTALACQEVLRDDTPDIEALFGAPLHPASRPLVATGTDAHPITLPHVALEQLKQDFLASTLPSEPVPMAQYLDWLQQRILPYVVNVSAGRYIGHMTSTLPAFMADLSALVSRLNQNMVKIETSKSLTFLERQTLAMLHRAFFDDGDYDARIQDPEHIFGLVVSGGSSANVTALWNARNRALAERGCSKAEIREHGAYELLQRLGYRGFAILASPLAHYSIRKAASLLGLGESNILGVKQDADQKADIQDLARRIEKAKARGLLVIAIVGVAGATETGTVDPLEQMADLAALHRIHFHVDAAWGGALVFSQRHRHLLQGIARADTVTLCAHKQLYVPQGISLCLFRNTLAIHATSVQATYQGRQGSFDIGQYTIEGSRPAIFLALHAMVHLASQHGIGALVDQNIDKTRWFADVIAINDAFELVGAPVMNILNYRYIPRALRGARQRSAQDEQCISRATAAIQEQQFLRGKTFVSKTDLRLQGQDGAWITVFRVVLANPLTTQQDLLDNLIDQLEIADHCVEPGELPSGLSAPPSLRLPPAMGWHAACDQLLSVGNPVAGVELLVLDKHGQPLPVGCNGEIHVGGEGQALQQLLAASEARPTVPHPHRPGARLHRTGDCGRRLADGSIAYCGRQQQHIKLRGFPVALAELEAQLLQLQGVEHAAVLADMREPRAALVAFVMLDPPTRAALDAAATASHLRRQLQARLPAYAVPETIHVLDTLPTDEAGHVDSAQLQRWLGGDTARSAPHDGAEPRARASARPVGV